MFSTYENVENITLDVENAWKSGENTRETILWIVENVRETKESPQPLI